VGNPDFKITKNSDFVITYGDLKLWPTKCAITINLAGQERKTFSLDHVSRFFPLVVTSREQSGFGDSWELKIEMGPRPGGRRSNSIYVTREYVESITCLDQEKLQIFENAIGANLQASKPSFAVPSPDAQSIKDMAQAELDLGGSTGLISDASLFKCGEPACWTAG
jgi:hypothetical protein